MSKDLIDRLRQSAMVTKRIEDEAADRIESLQQQLASCQMALADTEALEIGTGERLAKVEQQLTAANVLIAEQNKLGKERQEWALHTNEVIMSLNQQLAGAIAACKLKDEELEKIRGHIGLYNLFSCVGSDSYDPECADLNVGKCREIAIEALAIQPDDPALKAWLGEPVARLIPEGWVLVPKEPTEEMLRAPWLKIDEQTSFKLKTAHNYYKAMLTAAPKGEE